MTRLRAGRPRNCGLIPSRGKRFLCSPKLPARLWSPPSSHKMKWQVACCKTPDLKTTSERAKVVTVKCTSPELIYYKKIYKCCCIEAKRTAPTTVFVEMFHSIDTSNKYLIYLFLCLIGICYIDHISSSDHVRPNGAINSE